MYDLEDPYRWLVDTTVISCLESERLGKNDFYRMDNYILRLGADATRKLIDALRTNFNSAVPYRGKLYGWDTVIRLKAQELANYILGKRTGLGFGEPKPVMQRTDSETIRSTILSLSTAEARTRGIRKNTLWYLQQRARRDKSFTVYDRIRSQLR